MSDDTTDATRQPNDAGKRLTEKKVRQMIDVLTNEDGMYVDETLALCDFWLARAASANPVPASDATTVGRWREAARKAVDGCAECVSWDMYKGAEFDADDAEKRIAAAFTGLKRENEQLRAALKGVVRVADRKTDEFDAARAALGEVNE